MSEHLEGTIVLDGMLEGRLPDDPDVESKLRQWVDFARSHGLPFTLDISGNAFSLLPDNKPVDVGPIGDPPDQTIRQALDQLLEAFPPEARQNVFSTLRTSEYRPNEEVQSVYLVNPLGQVDVQSRAVDAKTVAPLPPLTTREKVKTAIVGLLIAAAILGVSSFFIDYRNLAGEVAETIRPIDPNEVLIDAQAYQPYLGLRPEVQKKNTRSGTELLIKVVATDAYPDGDAAMQTAYDAAPLSKRLALEALARGYVRAEVFSSEDNQLKFLYHVDVRIGDLSPGQEAEVAVPMPGKVRVGKIRITY
ncbi:MAG: hypothetical protein GC159_22820 [Phycisphaera sp.]|nr:hypothetical protein [Phycisphaera sp.]